MITIYRRSVNFWVFQEVKDGQPLPVISQNIYKGGSNGDYLSFTTTNGANIYSNRRFDEFTYIDETTGDPAVTFPSATDLMQFLNSLDGFFLSNADAVSANTFLSLSDVNDNSYIGKAGLVATVNSLETGLQLNKIVNSPIQVDEFRVIAKGNGNLANFKEVGDYCQGVYSGDGRFYTLVYEGGNQNDFASYRSTSSEF